MMAHIVYGSIRASTNIASAWTSLLEQLQVLANLIFFLHSSRICSEDEVVQCTLIFPYLGYNACESLLTTRFEVISKY
jgi:hypothetical protein